MKDGHEKVKNNTSFDIVDAVFMLDDTFKCFSSESRFFDQNSSQIDRIYAEHFCREYGKEVMRLLYSKDRSVKDEKIDGLSENESLGYMNGQQLLGFYHNTPNNTIPIMWCDENGWFAIFKRYNKIY